MATLLGCPICGSTLLDTLEVATCVARCDRITTDGPEFEGTTAYERGEQTTVGVICNECQWEYQGADWLTKLVAAVPKKKRFSIECQQVFNCTYIVEADSPEKAKLVLLMGLDTDSTCVDQHPAEIFEDGIFVQEVKG